MVAGDVDLLQTDGSLCTTSHWSALGARAYGTSESGQSANQLGYEPEEDDPLWPAIVRENISVVATSSQTPFNDAASGGLGATSRPEAALLIYHHKNTTIICVNFIFLSLTYQRSRIHIHGSLLSIGKYRSPSSSNNIYLWLHFWSITQRPHSDHRRTPVNHFWCLSTCFRRLPYCSAFPKAWATSCQSCSEVQWWRKRCQTIGNCPDAKNESRRIGNLHLGHCTTSWLCTGVSGYESRFSHSRWLVSAFRSTGQCFAWAARS